MTDAKCEYRPLILGHNIGTTHGYVTTSDRALETGADTFQIFYRPSRSYKEFHRPEDQTLELAGKIKDRKQSMVIHSAYIINICQPEDDYRHYQGVSIIVDDLNVSAKLGAMGVIIHMGNDPDKIGDTECKNNFIKGIQTSLRLSDPRSTLILETGAGCGNEVSTSLEELGEIRDGLTASEQKRLKYCLDTCHLFAAGYAIDDPHHIPVIAMEIDRYIGWENVAVIHLNDSKDPLGSRRDNHQDIGKGRMNFYGLMEFINVCSQHNIPMILETPCNIYNDIHFSHQKQMKLIRKYHQLLHDPELLGPEIQILTRTDSHKETQKRKRELAKIQSVKTVRKKATKSK